MGIFLEVSLIWLRWIQWSPKYSYPHQAPSHNIQVGTERPRVMILPLCESTSRVKAHLRQLTYDQWSSSPSSSRLQENTLLQVGQVVWPTQPTRAGWFEGDYDMNQVNSFTFLWIDIQKNAHHYFGKDKLKLQIDKVKRYILPVCESTSRGKTASHSLPPLSPKL